VKKSVFIKVALIISFCVLFFLFLFWWEISSYLNPARINAWLDFAGDLAPLLYIVLMALAVVISPIPSVPLDLAAGAFFGPLLGTLYSAAGALGGAVISFLIARFLGRELIDRFLGGHINFCTTCSDKLLTKIVFLSRLLPIISFDVISYGAGLTRMSLKRFSLATFFGMLPLTFIYNYSGSVLVFGTGLTIILGLSIVILFFLAPLLIEKYDVFSMSKLFETCPGKRKK